MKSAFLYSLILLSAFSFLPLNAKYEKLVETETGKQPLGVYYDALKIRLHVLCAGEDTNFNGVYEEGEEKPSWWIIHPASGAGINLAHKVADFEMPFSFPVRPAFIPSTEGEDGRIYIPFLDRMRSYSLDDYSLLDDEVTTDSYKAAFAYGPHLLLTACPLPNENGSVSVFNPESGNTLQTMEAGINTQESIAMQTSDAALRIAALNIGTYSALNASTVHVGKVVHMQNPVLKEIAVGDVANHLSYHGDLVAVTMNATAGSHEVKLINMVSEEVVSTFPTGTTGWDGPRESYFTDNGTKLAVATYTGDIRIIDIASGEIVETVAAPGKVESFVEMDGYLAVVTPFPLTGFAPANKVIFYQPGTSVRPEDAGISIYPNPTSEFVNISVANGAFDLTVTDAFGRTVYTRDGMTGENLVSLSALGLSSGTYLVRLKSAGGITAEQIINYVR